MAGEAPREPVERARVGLGGGPTAEWYAEVTVRFGRELDPSGEDYAARIEGFYDALAEYLGGPEFEPSMLCREWGLETYLYVDADSTEEAAATAGRLFRESAELVWGPGTTAEITRVITAGERDLELYREGTLGEES